MRKLAPKGDRFECTIADGIVYLKFFGEITADDIMASREVFLADPRSEPGMSFLGDFTEASFARVHSSDMRRLALVAPQIVEGWPPCRMALVAWGDLEYGMTRMYQLLAKTPGPTIEVFRDYDIALAWLREPGPPAP